MRDASFISSAALALAVLVLVACEERRRDASTASTTAALVPSKQPTGRVASLDSVASAWAFGRLEAPTQGAMVLRFWSAGGAWCLALDCAEASVTSLDVGTKVCGFRSVSGVFSSGEQVRLQRGKLSLTLALASVGERRPFPAYVRSLQAAAEKLLSEQPAPATASVESRWEVLARLIPELPKVGSAGFAGLQLDSPRAPPKLKSNVADHALANVFLNAILVSEGQAGSTPSLEHLAGAAYALGLTRALRGPLARMAADTALDQPNRLRAAYTLRQLSARSDPKHPFGRHYSRGLPSMTTTSPLAWVDALGAHHACADCEFLWPTLCR